MKAGLFVWGIKSEVGSRGSDVLNLSFPQLGLTHTKNRTQYYPKLPSYDEAIYTSGERYHFPSPIGPRGPVFVYPEGYTGSGRL